MNQSIPLRNISLQNEIGLGEECLSEQAPDQFLIAWRRALPLEQCVGMRGFILDIALRAVDRVQEQLSRVPDMEIDLTYLDDDYVITDQAVINALSDWKKEVKPYIDQRDADDLTNVIGLYRHEINDH